jgi:hypothetical protein
MTTGRPVPTHNPSLHRSPPRRLSAATGIEPGASREVFGLVVEGGAGELMAR